MVLSLAAGARPFDALPYRRERHLAINSPGFVVGTVARQRGPRLHLTALILRDKTTKPATPETAQPLAPRTADVGTGTASEVRGCTT